MYKSTLKLPPSLSPERCKRNGAGRDLLGAPSPNFNSSTFIFSGNGLLVCMHRHILIYGSMRMVFGKVVILRSRLCGTKRAGLVPSESRILKRVEKSEK